MAEYKRLERNLVSKGSIIDYYQDTILVPNGSTAKWDHIEHHGAAAVVAVDPEGRLLMVRQWRNSLDRETLEIPAGGINHGESSDLAAARECKEETGYTAGKIEFLMSINTTVAFCNEKIDIYLATELTKGEQDLDEDEFLEAEAYELDELLRMIDRGELKDSKTVCAILRYSLLNNK